MADINELLRRMAEHTATHPTHGLNCACKDNALREVKNHLRNHPEQYQEFRYLATFVMRDKDLGTLRS
jgi:hypothetical protein